MTTIPFTRWPRLENPVHPRSIPSFTSRRPRRARAWLGIGLLLVGLFTVLVHSGPLLRLVDPTAAVVDVGALSLVFLAMVALVAFLTISRWLIGLLWPVLRDYQKDHFSTNFKSLQPWQKIAFYLVMFFGLLYAFVCCLVAVY